MQSNSNSDGASPNPLWDTREKRPIQASALHYAGLKDVYRPGRRVDGALAGIDDNAAFLRRCEFIQRKLVYLSAGHIPSRSRWELKIALGKHLYEDAEATTALRSRILELRKGPRALSRVPSQSLALLMEELLHAASDTELVLGLYEVMKPALLAAYQRHMRETQQVADQPTIRILRQICWDLEEQLRWGKQAITELVDEAGKRSEATEFKEKIHELLTAAGGISGQEGEAAPVPLRRWRSQNAFSLPMQAIRDEHFPGTVHYRTGAAEYAKDKVEETVYWFMRIRQEEMEVVELLGSVIWQTQDQPWEWTADVARHLWDEDRHAMLGQIALEAEGIDWMSYPQHTSIYDAHVQRLPSAQHAYLWAIESMQMPKEGKRAEYEFARDKAQHPLWTQFSDYDWADEVVHVHIGDKRVPELYDSDEGFAQRVGQQALDEWWATTESAQQEHLDRVPVESMRPGESTRPYGS